MMDAILRTLTRLTLTHSNLLEWETVAEAESGKKKTPVETLPERSRPGSPWRSA